MTRFLARVALLLGAWVGLLLTSGDRTDALEQPVSIAVRPQVLIARGDVRVQIRVAPDVDNRALILAWTSDTGTAGLSRWPVDGADGPVLFVRALPDTPPARYTFVATLIGVAGEQRGRATANILTADDGGGR